MSIDQYAANFTCWSVAVNIYVFLWFRKWAGLNDLLALGW